MHITFLFERLFAGILGMSFLSSPSLGFSQYAASTAPKSNKLYIICSLVDDPHKTVYYSGVFRGVDPSLHAYEKSFSTHLEMSATNLIGTAKCSSFQDELAAKANMANLQENWRWIYKNSINTNWMYTPLSKYSEQ
ncbi:hypothetical protein AciX9_4580 (plasmid) [Granulicella tundricola MP5ACTX9]|uniref:Uncharacterized protein n=1 Tax=Granulicella tundricola (strain ATCC BAA-1859 / DSM 23138 / MP5ACTX9) TaxID=1198114 RepID=E8X7S6_GRATM|nr:hypothetical protein AciX9_4580 [Granulicella tundricola MP5ACTX9]